VARNPKRQLRGGCCHPDKGVRILFLKRALCSEQGVRGAVNWGYPPGALKSRPMCPAPGAFGTCLRVLRQACGFGRMAREGPFGSQVSLGLHTGTGWR
jgi:hypothetical protein